MKFIRVNGRVVPIKDKGPSKKQWDKNYKKHGDGANQASRIDAKYEKKAEKKGIGGGVVAAAGLAGTIFSKSKKFKIISASIGVAGAAYGRMRINKALKKSAVNREREYVRTFGTTSDGSRPTKNKLQTF